MGKLLFLGIDALDSSLLARFEADLPNLTALRRKHASLKVRSTFPPDSDTAWATIMTGLNPAQHGIVRFVDPLEKSYQILNVPSSNAILQGRTFWEIVSHAGLKTNAIFPHLCYPIWQTPGLMVARGSNVVGVAATQPEVLADYPNSDSLLGVRGFPDRNVAAMKGYADKLRAQAEADAEFALRMLSKQDWDLSFVYWSTIDAIGHFFWSYFDPTDPGFIEGHALQNVIPETYRLYDAIVGRFLQAVGDDVTVMIVSDHGHGGRPFKLVSVNEILRIGGFLRARDLKAKPHLSLLEYGKRTAIKTVSRYGLGRVAGRMMRRFPGAVQTFTRPSSIDWESTVAYATDMSGIKSYTYGGIRINREVLGTRSYETVRSEIIALLERECISPRGDSLLRFAARREDLYEGPYINNYPDIILEFKYGFGVGWAVHSPLITQAASYNLVPGSHRGETGTCIIRSTKELRTETIDLLDITPTVLDILGVKNHYPYDGLSVLSHGSVVGS